MLVLSCVGDWADQRGSRRGRSGWEEACFNPFHPPAMQAGPFLGLSCPALLFIRLRVPARQRSQHVSQG